MRMRVDFSTERDFEWLLARVDLEGARRIGERDILVRCPAHDDYSPSLHIKEDEQGLLCHCFAGCSRADIEDAFEDARPQPTRKLPSVTPRSGKVVASYDYRNADGELLYRKNRLELKSFEFRRPVVVPARTSGPVQHSEWVSWRPGLKDTQGNYVVEPVPYNLPEVIDAGSVWIVDGEKDADALNLRWVGAWAGIATDYPVATCSPFGMGRWQPEWNEYLRGKRVTIVADRDGGIGYRDATKLAESLTGIAASVRIVQAAAGKDAYDHLAAGFSVAQFEEVA